MKNWIAACNAQKIRRNRQRGLSNKVTDMLRDYGQGFAAASCQPSGGDVRGSNLPPLGLPYLTSPHEEMQMPHRALLQAQSCRQDEMEHYTGKAYSEVKGDGAMDDTLFDLDFDFSDAILYLCGLHLLTPMHVLTCGTLPRAFAAYGHKVTVDLIHTLLIDARFSSQEDQLIKIVDGVSLRIDIVVTGSNGCKQLWIDVVLATSWHALETMQASGCKVMGYPV
jgi:hypothetical protein